MGRQIRRVPVDFAWPIDKTWDGFLTPDSLYGWKCVECDGTGQSASGWWLSHILMKTILLGEDVHAKRRGRKQHPWLAEDPYPYGTWSGPDRYRRRFQVARASDDIVELLDALGVRGDNFLGYNVSDSWRLSRVLIKAAGLPNWGVCVTCDGEGDFEAYRGQRSERQAWEATEPPTGDGWQLWETVSEGSPISPVFDSPEGLAGWMSSPAYHWGASRPMQYDAALRFVVGDGWAPSMVFTPESGLVSGEEFIGGRS